MDFVGPTIPYNEIQFSFSLKLAAVEANGTPWVNAIASPARPSKGSFQVNGFGGAKMVRAKEMNQVGIIPIDQGVYFLNPECF